MDVCAGSEFVRLTGLVALARSAKSAKSAGSARSGWHRGAAVPVLIPALLALLARPGIPTGPVATTRHSHDTHVSHTRLVLEGNTIALRVRLFHDDLTLALKAFSHLSDLTLTPETRGDSVFSSYYAQHVKLEVNGEPVSLRVTASGMERDDAAQEVVWYVLEASLEQPATKLVMLNGLLFDAFKDQQNIVQLLRLPGDARRTLYFTAVDPRAQTVAF